MTESPWPSAHQYSIALRNDRGNAGSHQNHRVTPPARVALGALPAPVAYPLQLFGAKQKKAGISGKQYDKQKNNRR